MKTSWLLVMIILLTLTGCGSNSNNDNIEGNLGTKDNVLKQRDFLELVKEDVFGVGTLPYLQGGVTFSGVVEDPTLGQKIYKPGHPDADENGYIRQSNVNAMVDIADALVAQRAYEANLAVVNISKSMAQRALEIGK